MMIIVTLAALIDIACFYTISDSGTKVGVFEF